MKKFTSILCALLLFALPAALAETPAATEEITLEGNPSTGYTWTYIVSGDAVTVTPVGAESPETDTPGAPMQYAYQVKAVRPGESTLIFTYVRPWLTIDENWGESLSLQVVYNALVDDEGNLTLTPLSDTRVLTLEGLGTAEVTVSLAANPTTGYEWVVAKQSLFTVTDDGYQADEAPEGMVGTGGVQVYTITAGGRASGTVDFVYIRSFEENTPSVNSIVLPLTADGQGHIFLSTQTVDAVYEDHMH